MTNDALRLSRALGALLLCGAAACASDGSPAGGGSGSGDDAGTTDAAVGRDAEGSGDDAGDVGDDIADAGADTTDVADDTATDVAPDGSGDDAGDAGADAADATPDAEPWPFDYPEPECVADDDCAEGQGCVGGGCFDPIAPEDYAFDGALAYARDLWLPTTREEACCFDLDGDGFIDNSLSNLLEACDGRPGATVGALEQLNTFLEYGELALLLHLRGVGPGEDGPVEVAMFTGSNDIDSDGNPDDTWDARRAGDGTYLIDASVFGDYGSNVQYGAAEVTDGVLRTTSAGFAAAWPIYQPCSFRFHESEPFPDGSRCRGEQAQPFETTSTRAEAELRWEGDRLFTADTLTGSGDDERTVGGLMLGGYLHLDTFASIMNATYADNCGCVGLGRSDDLIVTGTRNGRYFMECSIAVGDEELAECNSSQRTCFGIPDFCRLVPVMASFAEHDGDGDGVNDSVSYGVRVSLVGAEVGDDVYMPPRENCRNERDDDGDGLASCDDPQCWDDTNCGGLGHSEWCHNGRDDDGDGETDCEDGACRDNLACVE